MSVAKVKLLPDYEHSLCVTDLCTRCNMAEYSSTRWVVNPSARYHFIHCCSAFRSQYAVALEVLWFCSLKNCCKACSFAKLLNSLCIMLTSEKDAIWKKEAIMFSFCLWPVWVNTQASSACANKILKKCHGVTFGTRLIWSIWKTLIYSDLWESHSLVFLLLCKHLLEHRPGPRSTFLSLIVRWFYSWPQSMLLKFHSERRLVNN